MKKVVALESRLKPCRNVITIGVKPNFFDYSHEEREIIFRENTIYYPSLFYANLLKLYGKKVFPSCSNYYFAQDKIKQTTLFQMNDLPHPRTHFFYGHRQKRKILDHFTFPFIAKIPRGSALGRGVFMICNNKDLEEYLNYGHLAYIQEYLPIDRDLRIIIIGKKIVNAYWRIMKKGEFRSNLYFGSTISFDYIPDIALKLALTVSRKFGLNDVGIDICQHCNSFYLLEINMKYGLNGFTAAGINYFKFMENNIQSGCI